MLKYLYLVTIFRSLRCATQYCETSGNSSEATQSIPLANSKETTLALSPSRARAPIAVAGWFGMRPARFRLRLSDHVFPARAHRGPGLLCAQRPVRVSLFSSGHRAHAVRAADGRKKAGYHVPHF